MLLIDKYLTLWILFQFFRPIEPVNVRIIMENAGRPSGEADVEFASHEEALKAMCKVRIWLSLIIAVYLSQKDFVHCHLRKWFANIALVIRNR